MAAGSDETREYVRAVVAEAPPLRDDQRVALAELLRPARQPAEATYTSQTSARTPVPGSG